MVEGTGAAIMVNNGNLVGEGNRRGGNGREIELQGRAFLAYLYIQRCC